MSFEKVKAHLEKHKTVYIAVSTAVSVAGITWLIMRDRSESNTILTDQTNDQIACAYSPSSEALVHTRPSQVIDPNSVLPRGAEATLPRGVVMPDQAYTGSFVFANNESVSIGDITTNVYDGNRGHPGFITRWVETGDVFPTQGQAAKAIGTTDSVMSGHLNGKLDDVFGNHFERICMAA